MVPCASIDRVGHFLWDMVLGVLLAQVAAGRYAQIIPQDRRITWHPGVPGGIPTRTVMCANAVTGFGAIGNGVADDSGAIENAINACPTG
jgi:hypothetical protein